MGSRDTNFFLMFQIFYEVFLDTGDPDHILIGECQLKLQEAIPREEGLVHKKTPTYMEREFTNN